MNTIEAGRRTPADSLQGVVSALFEAAGTSAPDASLAADALVCADVRGVRTHGVGNLAPRYLEWLGNGLINPKPQWRITRGSASLINVDGDGGLGVVVAAQVMDAVIERAKQTGLCMATVHNSRHLGMAAFHAMRALPHEMIGVCTTAVRARMVPTFGREPRLGTNPIAVAVPTGEMPAFVFDAAMTTVASNVLRMAMVRNQTVAPGLVVGEDGGPVREPHVPQEPFRLTPLGGTPEGSSHKGYGLAAVVDILSSILSQARSSGTFSAGEGAHCLVAIDIDAVLPVSDFRQAMDEFLQGLGDTPCAPGYDEVLFAGEREHRAAQRNLRDGVLLDPQTLDWLESSASEIGLDDPFHTRR